MSEHIHVPRRPVRTNCQKGRVERVAQKIRYLDFSIVQTSKDISQGWQPSWRGSQSPRGCPGQWCCFLWSEWRIFTSEKPATHMMYAVHTDQNTVCYLNPPANWGRGRWEKRHSRARWTAHPFLHPPVCIGVAVYLFVHMNVWENRHCSVWWTAIPPPTCQPIIMHVTHYHACDPFR